MYFLKLRHPNNIYKPVAVIHLFRTDTVDERSVHLSDLNVSFIHANDSPLPLAHLLMSHTYVVASSHCFFPG